MASRITEVHRIILGIRIAIERLQISHVIAAVVGVGLIEAMPLARVAAHHRFVAAVVVSLVGSEAVGLKGRIAAA